jgi:hypothetical protein
VQHRQNPISTEMPGSTAMDRNVPTPPEQDIIDHGLILERDHLDLGRHRNTTWKPASSIPPGDLEPFSPRGPALRAVAVATRVEQKVLITQSPHCST